MPDNEILLPESVAEYSTGQTLNESGQLPTTPQQSSQTSDALSNINPSLSNEEAFNNSGVFKLLMEDNKRLKADLKAEHEISKENIKLYYDADKRASVLEERVKNSTPFDIFFGVISAFGTGIAALSPSLWKYKPFGLIALLVGAALVVCAIIVKIWEVMRK